MDKIYIDLMQGQKFIDWKRVSVRGGTGGNGCVSFDKTKRWKSILYSTILTWIISSLVSSPRFPAFQI